MTKIIVATLDRTNQAMAKVPAWFVALLARVAIASAFWLSVQTKISGWDFLGQSWKFWNVSQSTFLLFEHEYAVPLLPVKFAANLATYSEFFLSIAIVLGLLTRLSAMGLLIMTAVIQLFVYPNAWGVHILWGALLIYLIRYGGGTISIDYLLRKKKT